MSLTVLRKQVITFADEFEEAGRLAADLHARMGGKALRGGIAAVHQLGGTSHQVQALLGADLEALGFRSEKRGLFAGTGVPGLRPDFYRPVGRSGVIAEVERGKTITNNMDLLDLWKCHLCEAAHFLFLVVPHVRASADGRPIRAFDLAARRLATFFEPRSYVNVEAVFLFGY